MSTARARLMRRARHYLSVWQVQIGLDNQAGLTDINSEAEDFCCGLLNEMLDGQFHNLNLERMNFPAVDLGDRERRICVQVTSTAGSEKIDHTLERFFFHGLHRDYDRLIVLVLGKKQNHRKTFRVEDGFSFEPGRDIWDIARLLTQMAGLDMLRLNRVDCYLREQLGEVGELAAPMDFPVLSALEDDAFLGRETELAQIAERFEAKKQFVFLSGLGGMGKTELAVRFAQTRWGGESYFVSYTRSWKDTVLENIAPRLPEVNRDTLDTEKIYRETMAVLRARGAEELLILDNADQEAASLTQLRRELSGLNMRILITTRTEYEHAIDVAQLHRAELHRLFDQHESQATERERDALIDAVDGHTLTVDLMARALRPGRRAATAEKLLKNLSDSSVKKVDTAYPGGMKQARINEHLRTVFRVSELPEEETDILRYATLLPEGGMDDGLFLAAFDDRETVDDLLQSLIDKGWLLWKDELLKIHPVIRLVCREELEPTDGNCLDFLVGIRNQYDPKRYNHLKFRQMAELFENASTTLEDKTGFWASWAGYLWNELADPQKALSCNLRSMEKGEQHQPDSNSLATAYNNVGMTYGDLGDQQKALEYKLKALAIWERVLPEDHPDLAQSYNNVGTTYGDLGEHQKALEYNLKALAIRERVLPEDHPDLATSCNNVGCTYGDLGDQQKALEYQQKALAIRERVLPEDHP
ncbi:MAG: tetratricopeptide repeat protein, partial [Oscillospiraceae bacterium]|nr:tetratricopeptide repeat protein [Oscillospiraceae bacterium]